MFLILAIVLLMVWGVGSLAFHAVGAMIHLLLILALVSVLFISCAAVAAGLESRRT